jgi:hypothetical protein
LDFGFWISDLRSAWLALAILAVGSTVLWADTYAESAAKIKSLTSDQKTELLRKKERFDKLSEAEKARLRELHAQLVRSPDWPELEKLMGRYCNWLKGLNPRERDEMLSLPADKRIARVKEIVGRQEGQRFTDYITYHLPKPDQEAIYKWLEEFVSNHEQEILDRLSPDDRRRIQTIGDEKARRKSLIQRLPRRRADPSMPYPSAEESDQMVAGLSSDTRSRLESPAGTDRATRVRELVGAAITSVSIPPPSEDDLRKFFASLPAAEKGRLEEMDSEQMQRALRFMWYARHFPGRGGPGGFRGDGGREGSRGPRPPGPPPPGFASPK